MATLRRGLRLPAMIALLFLGLFITLVLFPMWRLPRRERVIAWWSRLLLRACGVRVAEGAQAHAALSQLQGPGLLTANHISWVDIFVINALRPASFVAKDDIARWPLVGLLVGRVGTLFLERGRRHAVRDAIHRVERCFGEGRVVAVFPEGTTSDGRRLLPFHANLIQAAVHAQVPVHPVGVRYVDARGTPSEAVEFIGDTTFVASVWRLVAAPATVAEVTLLAPIGPDPSLRRHDIAERARAAISACLELPLEDTLPERLRDLRAERR